MLRATAILVYVACPLLAGAADTQIARTEALLREQVRLHPDNFRTNHLLGEFLIQQHNIAGAVPLLEKARRIEPSDYANSYDLALAYLKTGQTGKGRRLITQMLEAGEKAELHNLLADVEQAEGNIEEAARQYEVAARMDPSEKNLFDLGSYLTLHRGFEPALQVFEFGTQRYPQSAKLRVGLGVSYYSLGQYDEAVASLCQAVDLDPKDTKALDFLGKMYDISPQYADEVTKRLAQFVQIYPKNAAANYYYALSLRKLTVSSPSTPSMSDAEEYLLRAVTLNPAFAEAYYELGVLHEEGGKITKAIQEYERAAELRVDLGKAHYHLARLYQKEGRTALAQKEFRRFEQLKSKQ